MNPAGNIVVVTPVIQPRLDAGTNSCTTVISTVYRPVTPNPTKKRQITRYSQPCSGVSAINPVGIEKFRIVAIMTLRRPILSAAQPQNSEPSGALPQRPAVSLPI